MIFSPEFCEKIAELTDGKHEYSWSNAGKWHISKRKCKPHESAIHETNNRKNGQPLGKTNTWQAIDKIHLVELKKKLNNYAYFYTICWMFKL